MGKQPCDVCGENRECFTHMDSNKKAHTVCSDKCMDSGKGKGTDTSPVLGGGRMVLDKAFRTGWSVVKFESDAEWLARRRKLAEPGWLTCPNCNGGGMQGTGDSRGGCDDCGGIGKVPPCSKCNGPTYGKKWCRGKCDE